MTAALPWPAHAGCIGPDSGAVWNPLSVAQVDTILEAVAAGFTPAEIAELAAADRAAVAGYLGRHGLARFVQQRKE